MSNLGIAVFLGGVVWMLNQIIRGQRLKRFKGIASHPEWLEIAKMWILFVMGWALSTEWVGGILQTFDFKPWGVPVFGIAAVCGFGWMIIDTIDGGGIKPFSHKVAFCVPLLAATTSGKLHDLVTSIASTPDRWVTGWLDGWI